MSAATATWVLAVPVLAWIATVAVLAVCQRHFIYHPPKRLSRRPDWMTEARQNGQLLGWWCPPRRNGALTLMVFHGNRGTLERIAQRIEPWHAQGYGLFAATYPGFEANPGPPSESALYAAGRAALAWIEAQGVVQARIVLYGESLGCAIATQLATEKTPRALILEAPFAGLAELAAKRYPFAPVSRLLRDRYDNEGKIGHVTCPILILHGEADPTIPIAHAERLQAKGPNATLIRFPGANHIDLYEYGAALAVSDFLSVMD